GEPTTVQWKVTNFGNTTWSGTRYWVDDVYFSPYPTFDGNSTFVGEVAHSNDQPLGPGNPSYTASLTFDLPRGIGGTVAHPQTFYVYVVTDPTGTTHDEYPGDDVSRDYYTKHG